MNAAFYHRLLEEFHPPYSLECGVIEYIAVALSAPILSIYNKDSLQQAEQYDLQLIELSLQDENLFNAAEQLLRQKTSKGQRVIGVVEGCPFDYNRYPFSQQLRLFELYSRVDGLLILNSTFSAHYQQFNDCIIDCGIPFPLEYARQSPSQDKSSFTIELVNLVPDDRNTLYTLSAYEYLVSQWDEMSNHTTLPIGQCTTTCQGNDLRRLKRLFPNVSFISADKYWPQYISWKKQTISLTWALDHRHALGRCAIDSAACGIPAIGSGRSYYQKALFPDLCVDIHDFDSVVRLTRSIVESGWNTFPDLGPYVAKAWKKRFLAAL